MRKKQGEHATYLDGLVYFQNGLTKVVPRKMCPKRTCTKYRHVKNSEELISTNAIVDGKFLSFGVCLAIGTVVRKGLSLTLGYLSVLCNILHECCKVRLSSGGHNTVYAFVVVFSKSV